VCVCVCVCVCMCEARSIGDHESLATDRRYVILAAEAPQVPSESGDSKHVSDLFDNASSSDDDTDEEERRLAKEYAMPCHVACCGVAQ